MCIYIYKRGLEKSFLSPYAYFKYSFISIMICRASCLAWNKIATASLFFSGSFHRDPRSRSPRTGWRPLPTGMTGTITSTPPGVCSTQTQSTCSTRTSQSTRSGSPKKWPCLNSLRSIAHVHCDMAGARDYGWRDRNSIFVWFYYQVL